MPEIPDVATLTVISKDWGNQIRDRTIQRYSSVSNRTTEHPSPAEGDLSYLEDSNTVWVYDGSAWVNIAAPIQTADLADSAVTSAKIANATIAPADLANGTISGGWVDFAQSVNPNPLVLTDPAYQDCASVSINFTTLGWGSGRLLGWGAVGADGNGTIGLNVRVVLSSDIGTVASIPAGTDMRTASVSSSHWVTTLSSGVKTATIQAAKSTAVVTTKRYAWICMWAVRTS